MAFGMFLKVRASAGNIAFSVALDESMQHIPIGLRTFQPFGAALFGVSQSQL